MLTEVLTVLGLIDAEHASKVACEERGQTTALTVTTTTNINSFQADLINPSYMIINHAT